ncbi:MAG: SDR family oxidoreductase [Firmicutes bacterium]|nr:SDR family oxidoreductase [Bacillota bacterium]
MLALVTGASSGIGKEISLYLASLGYNLIIVARNKDELEKLKNMVNVEVKTIILDLSVKENIFKLYEIVKDEIIDIWVNNAGFGLFGEFLETDLNKELEMINLNVISYHILTKLYVQDAVKRGSGYLLNVCSSAGFMAGPRLNTYYATKNYVTKLTMALNEELKRKHRNVQVSALCPGPVNTNFNKVAHGDFVMKGASAKEVARYGIDKLLKRKMLIIPKFSMKSILFLIRFVPYRLQLMITYKIQYQKEVKYKK